MTPTRPGRSTPALQGQPSTDYWYKVVGRAVAAGEADIPDCTVSIIDGHSARRTASIWRRPERVEPQPTAATLPLSRRSVLEPPSVLHLAIRTACLVPTLFAALVGDVPVARAAIFVKGPRDNLALVRALFGERGEAAARSWGMGFAKGLMSTEFDLQSRDSQVASNAGSWLVAALDGPESDGIVSGDLVYLLGVIADVEYVDTPDLRQQFTEWARDLAEALVASGDADLVAALEEARYEVRGTSQADARDLSDKYDIILARARQMLGQNYTIRDSLRDRIRSLRQDGVLTRARRLEVLLTALEHRNQEPSLSERARQLCVRFMRRDVAVLTLLVLLICGGWALYLARNRGRSQ